MNGYIAFYKSKTGEVHANTSYEAQVKYATENKIPDKKRYLVTVVLAEKDGVQVTHVPDF